jgi:hypothetical protein
VRFTAGANLKNISLVVGISTSRFADGMTALNGDALSSGKKKQGGRERCSLSFTQTVRDNYRFGYQ